MFTPRFFLLTVSCAALLSGCSYFKKEHEAAPATQTPAAASAAAPTASAAEIADMKKAMGETIDLTVRDPKAPVALEPLKAIEAPATQPAPTTKPEAKKETIGAACPAVEILPETRSITYFSDPSGIANGDVIAHAAIGKITGDCTTKPGDVSVEIGLQMRAHIESKARKSDKGDSYLTFPYFVAVTDANGQMVDKQILATALTFPQARPDVEHMEAVRQHIALPQGTDASKYTVTIGFQLTRDQLAYNARATIRPDAAQPIKAGTKKMKPIL